MDGHFDVHDETLGAGIAIVAIFRDSHQTAQYLPAVDLGYVVEIADVSVHEHH